MRQIQKHRPGKKTRKTREPLAEGIVPLRKDGRIYWASMSADELVDYAEKFIGNKGISGRGELSKVDSGLYQALLRRKLLSRVGFEKKKRDWASMSNDEIVSHAKRVMKEKGISGRTELVRAYSGLYTVLRKRKLLDKVGFEEKLRKMRPWASMSDGELVAYARRVMKKDGISGRGELAKADNGLYDALRKRKLLDKIGFEEKKRKKRAWRRMGDEELVAFTKKTMKENRISGRNELQRVDWGLYKALLKRKLLDRVFAPMEKARQRQADDEVIRVLEEFGGAE